MDAIRVPRVTHYGRGRLTSLKKRTGISYGFCRIRQRCVWTIRPVSSDTGAGAQGRVDSSHARRRSTFCRRSLGQRPRAVAKSELYERLWPKTFVDEANLSILVGESEPRWAIRRTGLPSFAGPWLRVCPPAADCRRRRTGWIANLWVDAVFGVEDARGGASPRREYRWTRALFRGVAGRHSISRTRIIVTTREITAVEGAAKQEWHLAEAAPH